jgi:hypothetical protein
MESCGERARAKWASAVRADRWSRAERSPSADSHPHTPVARAERRSACSRAAHAATRGASSPYRSPKSCQAGVTGPRVHSPLQWQLRWCRRCAVLRRWPISCAPALRQERCCGAEAIRCSEKAQRWCSRCAAISHRHSPVSVAQTGEPRHRRAAQPCESHCLLEGWGLLEGWWEGWEGWGGGACATSCTEGSRVRE